SLAFGTYRRHLATARHRLARWLWQGASLEAPQRPPLPAATEATGPQGPADETALPPERGGPAPPRLSIVVLPFVHLGGSSEQKHHVDALTEAITTDLSRRPGVFALSRNTAFSYEGKPVETRQIGRELGVRYVLEGSVQHAGARIRINAQLVDAESGAHVWAERFDQDCADLLDTQDEVTTRLARTVHVGL